MALEAGGYADKLGNRYESNWVAYLLLELLEEKVQSITIEPIGNDEIGVDVIVERCDGLVEYHQCKASNSYDEFWSFVKLKGAGVLEKALYQLRRGTYEFWLVSPLSSKNLNDLCNSAINSNGNVDDFIEFQVNTSEKRKKHFTEFCNCSEIDESTDKGLGEAYELLQRLKVVQYCDDLKALKELEGKANSLYLGEPSKLVHFLKYYGVERNRLRRKITLPQLLKDIEGASFERRLISSDIRVSPIIQRLSKNFIDSIEPYLITQQLISRPEAQEVIDATNQNGVVLIKAEAGMGKSAALLEIHNFLTTNGAVSLPVRLDRSRPEKNADLYGKTLGFSFSPIYCLAKFAPKNKCVVILDQLDAVRWTASHSNNALEVCKELVSQALNLRKGGADISVVLACRDFEVDEDLSLRNWIGSLSDDIATVSLGKLSSELVTEKIEPYEPFNSLSTEKKNVLTIPLWLGIYLTLAERDQCPPIFSSKLELVKKFWEDRYEDIRALGINGEDVGLALKVLLQRMDDESRLSIPSISIPTNIHKPIEALISVAVLTKNNGQISFRHQALFDFKLGEKFFEAALKSEVELLGQIGQKSKQTLTKREHLKYALNMLLAYSHNKFCSVVLAILESPSIRFHIKHLVFNSLRELDELKSSSKALIDKVFENANLELNFIHITCYGHSLFIDYLSNHNKINKLLNSEDEIEINRAIWLLSSVSSKSSDIVLRELKSFVGRSEEWNQRVYRALCLNIEDDSDEMFEVRKSLLSSESITPYIHWSELIKKHPARVVDLIELQLLYYREAMALTYYKRTNKSQGFARRDKWSESDIACIDFENKIDPKLVLSKFIKIAHEYSQDSNDAEQSWFSDGREYSYDTIDVLTRGVCSLIYNSAKQLSQKNPQHLVDIINPYLVIDTLLLNHLNTNILFHLPLEYADFVIEWFLDSPKNRLSCGNDNIEPKWLLPSKLVEKFSSYCSKDNLKALEKNILKQQASCDLESIKWKLEARRKGYFPSYWGEAQFFILPKLPEAEISNASKQLLRVLKRKFKFYTDEDFCHSNRGGGGWVTSPLTEPNKLSDKAWSKLILSSDNFVRNGRSVKYKKDSVIESSVEQFSRTLDQTVRNEPIRFAKLALTLPPDIEPKYINSFYWGLSESGDKNVKDPFKDNWSPCPPKLVEAVIGHFGHSRCVSSLVRLLESRYSENGEWSIETRELIINIAKTADSPEVNKLSLVKVGDTDVADDANTDSLENTSLNCDRGIAFRKVGNLFWDNEPLSIELRQLVQDAIDDPHPAVKIVALQMVLPIFNYDEAFASNTFLSLCSKELRASVARGSHYFFNSGFEGNRQKEYIELILTMLKSPFRDVRKAGAKQIFARWYFNDLFVEELEMVLSGEEVYREGIVSVLSEFLINKKVY